MHVGSHCPPGYFGMPPGSCEEMSSLSPCPFWTKPITHVGLSHITTVRKCVCVPIHMQLCSTGFPGGFRVTAFQARLTTLMVSRRDGACASLRHLEERNLTSTSPKLSRSTVSTSHPRPIGRFERTDRSFALRHALHTSPVGRYSHDYYGHCAPTCIDRGPSPSPHRREEKQVGSLVATKAR